MSAEALTPRRIGRPPLPPEERRTEVLHFRLTAAEYDRLCREAIRRGTSVNALVRDLLGFAEDFT